MKETITGIFVEYTFITIGYIFIISCALIYAIVDRLSKKHKYMDWKKSKINIFFLYEKEWERNDDLLLKELFEENLRLERENKKLNKQMSKLSIIVLIFYVIQSLKDKFRNTIHTDIYIGYQEEIEIFNKKIKEKNEEIEKVKNANIEPSLKEAELIDLAIELEELEIERKAREIKHRKQIINEKILNKKPEK